VQHREVGAGDRDRLALAHPAVGGYRAGVHHAEAGAGLGQPLQQEQVASVRPDDRHSAQCQLQRGRPAGMVDMAVRQHDLGHRHAQRLDARQDHRHVAARIDHCRLLGGAVMDDRAVLLKRRHRHDRDGDSALLAHRGSLNRHCERSEAIQSSAPRN